MGVNEMIIKENALIIYQIITTKFFMEIKQISWENFYNNNNNNNLWTYCAQLNMRMISCTLQLRYFTRNMYVCMYVDIGGWRAKM